MSGYHHHRYLGATSDEYPMRIVDDEDGYADTSSNQHGGPCNRTFAPSWPPNHRRAALEQPASDLVGMEQNQTPWQMSMQHGEGDVHNTTQIGSEGSNIFGSFYHTNVAQPPAQPPWYGRRPDCDMARHQERRCNALHNLQTHSNAQDGDRYYMQQHLNGSSGEDGQHHGYDQAYDMRTGKHVDLGVSVSMPLDPSIVPPYPLGGTGDLFISGVLARPQRHTERLGTYTNRLFHKIDATLTGGSDPHVRMALNDSLRPVIGSQSSEVLSSTGLGNYLHVLGCPLDSCNAKFTGRWGHGNLKRHFREKHRDQTGYPCIVEDCDKIFQRKDARLKHYRRDHKYLNTAPPMSRKASSSMGSTYTGSSYTGSPYVDERCDYHNDGSGDAQTDEIFCI